MPGVISNIINQFMKPKYLIYEVPIYWDEPTNLKTKLSVTTKQADRTNEP